MIRELQRRMDRAEAKSPAILPAEIRQWLGYPVDPSEIPSPGWGNIEPMKIEDMPADLREWFGERLAPGEQI